MKEALVKGGVMKTIGLANQAASSDDFDFKER